MTGPEWDDALLADLGRAYRNHPDVADLVAGVRRVLALHAPATDPWPDGVTPPVVCDHCREPDGFGPGGNPEPYPCATVRALNHPEESP